MNKMVKVMRTWLRNFSTFAARAGGVKLYRYQLEAANGILESVRFNLGRTFVVSMARQSGKDEMVTQLLIYLMRCLFQKDRTSVVVNPTYEPQTLQAIQRLESRLEANLLTRKRWNKRGEFYRMIGTCRTAFLSGDGEANVVGATANLLLVINEAQDIEPAVYEKNFAPMAASRNATRVFLGTPWTSTTLLAQMTRLCRQEEQADGIQRVFISTAEDVRKENERYGKFVDGEVRRLGRSHPFVKTQYFCEEVDAQAGMFPPGRQALMHGSHAARNAPEPGRVYAFLVDVAGQDEAGTEAGKAEPRPGRDSTVLKIVQVDMTSVPELGKPTYLVVFRREWTGEKHVQVFGAIRALAQTWKPLRILIDATGVGEGLWSLLDNALGAQVVLPVKFTAKLKSDLGYGFIGIVESGRYREYHPFPDKLRRQLDLCRSEIVPGPAMLMRWGVPDGTRDELSGEPVHDDDLTTAAMCTLLDKLDWQPRAYSPGVIIPGRDPLEEMDRGY
ncbi:MAG: hypothetical protein WCE68_00625 [Anaerolineales bacterium]